MTDLVLAILYGSAAVSNKVNTATEAATKEAQVLRAEITSLKREIAKNKTPTALCEDLRIHRSRLPAAKRAARALGIHVTELNALAEEHNCSAARLIAAYAHMTRNEVEAAEANPTAEMRRALDAARKGNWNEMLHHAQAT